MNTFYSHAETKNCPGTREGCHCISFSKKADNVLKRSGTSTTLKFGTSHFLDSRWRWRGTAHYTHNYQACFRHRKKCDHYTWHTDAEHIVERESSRTCER